MNANMSIYVYNYVYCLQDNFHKEKCHVVAIGKILPIFCIEFSLQSCNDHLCHEDRGYG